MATETTAPVVRSPRAAKAVATTLQRGETLFFDGYTITPLASAMMYTVTTPERLNKKTGELYVIDYTVDVAGGTCNCEQFNRHFICKHVHGTRRAVAEARAVRAQADRLLNPVVKPTGGPDLSTPIVGDRVKVCEPGERPFCAEVREVDFRARLAQVQSNTGERFVFPFDVLTVTRTNRPAAAQVETPAPFVPPTRPATFAAIRESEFA